MNTTSKEANNSEFAFQAHITEYDCLRKEITLHLSNQNQLVNYSVVILGGSATLLAVGNPSLASQQPALLLIASILMSALSWAILEESLMMNDLGKYIEHVLTPKVQRLVSESVLPEYHVLSWEGTRNTQRSRLVLRGITELGKFSIPFAGSVTSIVLFYSLQHDVPAWSLIENWLFWIATAMVIIGPLIGLLNASYILEFGFKPYRMSVARKVKASKSKTS